MPSSSRLARLTLVAALVIPLSACFGEHKNGRSSASSALSVTVSPSHLSVPVGGGGYVAITVSRPLPQVTATQEALTLSLDQAPVGVTGSGTIAANQSTGTLSLLVASSVTPQTLQGLRVKAVGSTLSGQTTFDLTISAALPAGQLRADLVQASGKVQQGGTLVNTPVALEPVAATTAADAAQTESTRHGFHPAVPSN
jgi:hypothetical protein